MCKYVSMPTGRPTRYKKRYAKDIIDYFARPLTETKTKEVVSAGFVVSTEVEEANELPTIMGFAQSIGVCKDTIANWANKEKNPEFFSAYKKAKALQESFIAQNAFKGRGNTTFSIFFLKCNHGWKDRVEVDLNANIGINIDQDDAEL